MSQNSTGQNDNSILLASAQKDWACEVLAAAFQEDPMYKQIFPDSDERAKSLRLLWDAVVGYGLVYGEVYTTPSVKGVACWLSPGNTEVNLWRLFRTGFALQRAVTRFSKDGRKQFLDGLGYLDKIHKQIMEGKPHWYLWVLGVAPNSQGQGIGRRLIHPVLDRADKEHMPCYLETETERNVEFYKKRGFEVVSEGEVPGYSLKLWSLLREPLAYTANGHNLNFFGTQINAENADF